MNTNYVDNLSQFEQSFNPSNIEDYKILVKYIFNNYLVEDRQYQYKLYSVLDNIVQRIYAVDNIPTKSTLKDLLDYLTYNDTYIFSRKMQ